MGSLRRKEVDKVIERDKLWVHLGSSFTEVRVEGLYLVFLVIEVLKLYLEDHTFQDLVVVVQDRLREVFLRHWDPKWFSLGNLVSWLPVRLENHYVVRVVSITGDNVPEDLVFVLIVDSRDISRGIALS